MTEFVRDRDEISDEEIELLTWIWRHSRSLYICTNGNMLIENTDDEKFKEIWHSHINIFIKLLVFGFIETLMGHVKYIGINRETKRSQVVRISDKGRKFLIELRKKTEK